MTAYEGYIHARPRYGILGGTFDPPHYGHLVLAQEAYARLDLDRVWFVPAGTPPHKPGQRICEVRHRLAMVEAAVADDERFAVSTIEVERAGPSYTVDTLTALRARWGAQAWLCLILGWDMLASLPTWRDPIGVLAGADQIAAAHRPGYAVTPSELDDLESQLPRLRQKLVLLPAPQLDLAATSLRERVALGLPIRYLVPESVESYIAHNGLYREETNAPPARQPASGGEDS